MGERVLGHGAPRRREARRRQQFGLLVVLLMMTACNPDGASDPDQTARSTPATSPPTPALSPAVRTRVSSPTAATSSNSPTASELPEPPNLTGDRRNAFAFAPLDEPADVTVEGRVAHAQAWSTSKILVIAAFLDTAAGGDPGRVSSTNRRLIEAALTESDENAVLILRNQIPGRPGQAMTRVLRAIGDNTTVAPDNYQGLMSWSIREQVRFMAALAKGKVVSRAASAYLLKEMRPVKAHAWGLGTIGATAYKGGWLRRDTVTRQMGVVDGYAVAIITDAVGPAVRQSDGDSAHVRQMNRLARLLQERLAYERSRR